MKIGKGKILCIRGINYIFFGGLLFAYFAVTLFLFHRQTVGYGGRYISDMPPYVAEIQGIASGYDYPYPIMFWIARLLLMFTTPAHAMAFTVAVLNTLTAVALKYYFDRELQVQQGEYWGISTLLVFGSLFASMLYPLSYLGRYVDISEGTENFLRRYLGAFSPNPFQNATYLAARPFAVLVFFLAVDVLREYEKNMRWMRPKYVLFGLSLLAATMTKPSFTLVLVSACGIIMLWRLLHSRMKCMKAFWQLGIYFIPTFFDLLYQYRDVFTGGAGEGDRGVGIGFLTAWGTVTDNVLVSVLLGIAFPIVVLLFRRMRFGENDHLRFAWQLYAISLLMLMFLYEKGYRMVHINFAWGYMYGMFFLYVTSILTLAGETKRRGQPCWQLILQWSIFGLHVICGLDYFRVILGGGLFH